MGLIKDEYICPECKSVYGVDIKSEGIKDGKMYEYAHCSECGLNEKLWFNLIPRRKGEHILNYSKDIINEKCPWCGAKIKCEICDYFSGSVFITYHCSKCGGDGQEWYDYVFDGYTIEGSKDKNIKSVKENKNMKIRGKIMKFKSNQEGKCPICNSENLEYFGMELRDNSVYYPWHCPDCDTEGKEWYYASFSEVRDIDDNVCETEGMCPNCGCEGDIEYGTAEPDGMSLKYEFHCPECENSGYEWYDLDFDSHTIDGHEDEKIELVKESKSANDIETELKSKVAQYKKLKKVNKDDTSKSKDLEDEIEDLEAQLKKLKKEAVDYKDDRYIATTAEDTNDERAYYGKNMTKRDKVRSLDQAKRNLNRIGKDPRVTQGQAVDQVSFDDKALDTDLSRYKTNKAWAKKSAEKGDKFWTDEHNKQAQVFSDKIKAKHKKQEDIEDEEENDIDFDDTISLLDMALSEIPKVGVEDWGKDDELLFIADTKVLFENLKNYEHKIPKHYYDNAENDDWSNGIDDYLQENYGINVDDGDSDNTYNWNAPLTHNVEFTIYEANGKCFFKGSIHIAGDVRGNYTTEFLLEFNDKDDCLEAIFDACSENCVNEVTLDGVTYIIVPHFFSDCVSIFDYKNQKSYDDVYCSCIDELKEIIAGNTDDEPTQY